MALELARAVVAALIAAVLPGFPWMRVLLPSRDGVEQAAYTVGLSLALVPVTAYALAAPAGGAISPVIGAMAVAVVTLGGVLVYWRCGRASPLQPPAPAAPPPFRHSLVPLALASVLILVAVLRPVRGREWDLVMLVAMLAVSLVWLLER
ncbi:MAG: DUF1616 domain-containing protein, partial [Chloroflexota bacterium]|nr:DUF1616 domain-containing protein [Chloroflexota bacterium]